MAGGQTFELSVPFRKTKRERLTFGLPALQIEIA
jgi:hypothetical protein